MIFHKTVYNGAEPIRWPIDRVRCRNSITVPRDHIDHLASKATSPVSRFGCFDDDSWLNSHLIQPNQMNSTDEKLSIKLETKSGRISYRKLTVKYDKT